MSDGLSISERAIAAREARHAAKRAERQTASPPPDASRDPWHYAGGPGEFGHPNIDQGSRKAPDGLLERAAEAYGSLTRPDVRTH